MIKIMIQFNGKQLTLPVNPEKLERTASASNTNIDIIGLGKATRKGEPELLQLTIDSFFPNSNSYYYTGVSPKASIEFINEIWHTENTNNNVGKLVTLGLPVNINIYFVIENFSYSDEAGDEDTYYTLKIKQYIPYGVKTIAAPTTGLAAARATSPVSVAPVVAQTNEVNTTQTYTVDPGDCLWSITQELIGDGSEWYDLYDINRDVIGDNPNLIYPGTVLTLPVGW